MMTLDRKNNKSVADNCLVDICDVDGCGCLNHCLYSEVVLFSHCRSRLRLIYMYVFSLDAIVFVHPLLVT